MSHPTQSNVLQDLKHGLRRLVRQPGFTAVIVLTLAIGVGANTSIFSIVNAVLLRPLPYHDADRLVVPSLSNSRLNRNDGFASYPLVNYWQHSASSFAAISAYLLADATMTSFSEPKLVQTARVQADFFSVLGVQPVLGRAFSTEEEIVGKDQAAILSYGLWTREFGGAHNVLSRTVLLDGRRYRIIGVMPPKFAFPNEDVAVWVPLAVNEGLKQARLAFWANVVGRLRPDIQVEGAQAELNTLTTAFANQFPELGGFEIRLFRLHDQLVSNTRTALLLLTASVAFVLLVACLNVANLLLGRSEQRRHEIAIRAAVGASRLRLIQQLLIECSLLALIGGVVGVSMAYSGTKALIALAPLHLPLLDQIGLGGRVLLFALALVLITIILFGLAPAVSGSKANLLTQIREGRHSVAGRRDSNNTRTLLVMTQCAIAVMLVCGAGLLLRTVWNLRHVNPGFRSDHLLTAAVRLSPAAIRQPGQWAPLSNRIIEQLSGLPDVSGAGITLLLFENEYADPGRVIVEGEALSPRQQIDATSDPVSPSFFRVMSVPLLRGRLFDASDTAASPPVALINETMARSVWPNIDPIGKHFAISHAGRNPQGWTTVVGVVGDMRRRGLDHIAPCNVFVPWAQMPLPGLTVVLRTRSDPSNAISAMRRTIWSVDKDAAIWDVKTVDEYLDESIELRKFQMILLGAFAVIALLLAAIGIYGLIHHMVVLRNYELGIRIALGSSSKRIVWMVVQDVLRSSIIGAAAGVAMFAGFSRTLSSVVYGVTSFDPWTVGAASAILLFCALVASAVPAFHAARVDPIIALRSE